LQAVFAAIGIWACYCICMLVSRELVYLGLLTYFRVNWSLLTPNFWHASSRTSVRYLVGVVGILNVLAYELNTTTCDIMRGGVGRDRVREGKQRERLLSRLRASTSSSSYGLF
jgi:hypothetical protein